MKLRKATLAFLFAGLAVGMTFPDLGQLATHTPGDYGDGYLVQYVMRWDVARAADLNFGEYLDANIFWPAEKTLLYSDTLIPAAPVVWGLTKLLGHPIGFNLSYLATWIASLWAMYLLAMWFTRNRAASILAAIIFTFAAPRLTHYGHYQLNFAFLLPLSFYLLFRFLDERRWWLALVLGVTLACTPLVATYYGLMMGMAVPIVALGWWLASRGRPGRRFFGGLALAGGLALLIVAPISLQYLELQKSPEFQRGGTFDEFAAHPSDFLAPASGSYVYRALDEAADRSKRNVERRLFPGFLALLVGTLGLVTAVRGEGIPLSDPSRRRALALLLVVSALALVLSFGERIRIGRSYIPLPYAALDQLAGFRAIRATGRFTVLSLLGLAMLVALGFLRLTRGRSTRKGYLVATLLGAAMLAEYAAPIQTVPVVDDARFTAVNFELERRADGPVVELPMGDPRTYETVAYVEAPRMLLSSIDWRRRVNGYSGFFPPKYLFTVDLMNSLASEKPNPDAGAWLRNLGVRYIVLRTSPVAHLPAGHPVLAPGVAHYDGAAVSKVLAALPADRVKGISRHGDAVLVELKPWPKSG